jgi:hypothetical protein
MKILGLVLVLSMFLVACNDKPANSSYHNSSNEVRQNNKNVNVNANVNSNVNANTNVNR